MDARNERDAAVQLAVAVGRSPPSLRSVGRSPLNARIVGQAKMVFDYARLSLAEIREDLAETLSNQVVNAGQEELASLLDAIEEEALVEALSRASGPPSERLVTLMDQLVGLEPYGYLPEPGIKLARLAIQELRRAGGLLDG